MFMTYPPQHTRTEPNTRLGWGIRTPDPKGMKSQCYFMMLVGRWMDGIYIFLP